MKNPSASSKWSFKTFPNLSHNFGKILIKIFSTTISIKYREEKIWAWETGRVSFRIRERSKTGEIFIEY